MADLIDRQKAIDAIMELQPYNTKRELINRIESSIADAEGYLGGIAMALDEIEDLPSEHPEDYEWCTGCKEYDHERGCCPRFGKVIAETVEEVKQNLQVVHCKDCEYWPYRTIPWNDDRVEYQTWPWCHRIGIRGGEGYCSEGERRREE